MPDLKLQAIDIDYVKNKLIALQRQKAWGTLIVKFERGVMQLVDVNLHFKPPSNKDYEDEGLENY